MESLGEMVGYLNAISLDNWSEVRSTIFFCWCAENGIDKVTQPSKHENKRLY
jgi:hypothetical protein